MVLTSGWNGKSFHMYSVNICVSHERDLCFQYPPIRGRNVFTGGAVRLFNYNKERNP